MKDANGPLYAFADPVQRLWDWAPNEPPVSFGTRFRLRRNCRNSRWIAKTSAHLANATSDVFRQAPLGGKPMIDVVPTMAGMKGAVLTTVARLLREHSLLPSQIVLIGSRSFGKGSLAQLTEIAGVGLTDSIPKWRQGDGILVTTARSFKGLEADAVVVYDLEETSQTFTMIDLYVACTRGRSHLHFLVTGKQLASSVREALANAELEMTAKG